ncbi:cytochrome P450 [Fennellomyces sp. T-0311]|nr:cytochrome P450 [Fennellomyces sp. T-0311]
MNVIDKLTPYQLTSVATVATSTAAALYYLSRSSHSNKSALDLLPTPKGSYPYIGHLLSIDKLLGFKIKEWHDELGPVIRVQMGVQPWICISDPDIVHHLLVTRGAIASNRPHQKFIAEKYSKGERGVIFARADAKWKSFRAVAMSTTFSPKAVNGSIGAIQNDAMKLVSKLIDISETHGAFNPMQTIRYGSLNHVLQTCYGIQTDGMDTSVVKEILDFTEEMLILTATHNDFDGFLPALPYLNKLRGKNRGEELLQRMEPFLHELLRIAINSEQNCMFKTLYEQRHSLGLEEMDLLIGAGDMVAGATDNVAITLVSAFGVFLHHPDVYKRLSDDLDTFIREHNRLPVFTERDQFPFLNSVIKEVIRYRGTNYVTLPHVLEKDVSYKGYVFPKDVLILPSAYAMHRDPSRYPDPDKFMPERFMHETKPMAATAAGNYEKRDQFTFGWGRRQCPGIYLAETQLFVTLTAVLARCTLEIAENEALPDLDDVRDNGILVTPPPFNMRFVRRQDCLLPTE